MTRRDDNHRVAEIIKGLEQRIADLEEKDRSSSTPNLLRKATDGVTADTRVEAVSKTAVSEAEWDNAATGWDTGTWGDR